MKHDLECSEENPLKIIATDSRLNIIGNRHLSVKLLEHLRSGNTINFLQAMDAGFTFLNERIRVLQQETEIYSRDIVICKIKCKEYNAMPFTTNHEHPYCPIKPFDTVADQPINAVKASK